MSKSNAGDAHCWPARRALAAMAEGEICPADLIAACRSRIDAREPDVRAWQFLDWNIVETQLARIKAIEPAQRGPLWGLPVAVKDIFDTRDMPTGYGSPIYEGFRPAADAACVARLRAAGAIILGKTVSTEFAYWQAGKTRNPHDLHYSPGGSSSGSAAAVADMMVPLSIGSQTAASTVRPASYCGIIGYKPSRGLISLAGVKALANGLDTVGVFGRSVTDAALIAGVMAARAEIGDAAASTRAPRLRIWTGPEQKTATAITLQTVKDAVQALTDAGAAKIEASLPEGFDELCEAQTTVMAVEAARELAHEQLTAFDKLSKPLQELFAVAVAISPRDYDAARALRDDCLRRIDELFAGVDLLLLPSAPDVAPKFGEGTGDPVMSRAWTLLGLPSISLPCGTNGDGLPIGLQLAARPGHDAKLLSAAEWVEQQLSRSQASGRGRSA